MRVVAKLLLLCAPVLLLLTSSASAGQPRILAPGHVKTVINNMQRHKGIGHHSSGYHYQCLGCLPHEDWHPYQNLKHLQQTEINPEPKGQVSPSDIIREGKSSFVPFRFESR